MYSVNSEGFINYTTFQCGNMNKLLIKYNKRAEGEDCQGLSQLCGRM